MCLEFTISNWLSVCLLNRNGKMYNGQKWRNSSTNWYVVRRTVVSLVSHETKKKNLIEACVRTFLLVQLLVLIDYY